MTSATAEQVIGCAGRAMRHKAARAVLLAAFAASLAACAGAGSSVLTDPGKYQLYNCKQLAEAREGMNKRVIELEGLMAKAETGAGGSLVSGLAYQSDYVATKSRRDQLDEELARNNCSAELAASAKPSQPAPEQPATRGRQRH